MSKKVIIGIVAGVIGLVAVGSILFLTVFSDSANTDNQNNNTQNENNNNSKKESFEYGQDYINNNLGDYLLVFNVKSYENGESDSTSIEIRKTKAGYYMSSGGSETLFIKNGDKFDVYMGSDGEFEKSGMQYDEDMVHAMMNVYTMYMSSYASYGSELTKVGTDTVAGRKCDKYSYEFTYPMYNYKYVYSYYIDKATGVGLKHTMELKGEGKKMGYEFEATKFETSGVSLPAYQ